MRLKSRKTRGLASCTKRDRPEEGEARVRLTDLARVLLSVLGLQRQVWRQRPDIGAGAILPKSAIIRNECPQIIHTSISQRPAWGGLGWHRSSARRPPI